MKEAALLFVLLVVFLAAAFGVLVLVWMAGVRAPYIGIVGSLLTMIAVKGAVHLVYGRER